MEAIKQLVAAYCQDNGLTSAALADALGMSRSSLYAKLRGLAPWDLEEAVKLAQILGIDLNKFADYALDR